MAVARSRYQASLGLPFVAARLSRRAAVARYATRAQPPELARVGDVGQLTRSFSPADVADFARLTGDDNPIHEDERFAATQQFGRCVVHGMLYASMFSAIIGQRSPGAVYLSQTLTFRKPVYLGDTLTAEVEVQRVGRAGRLLDFATRCTNEHSELVLSGDARVLMPERNTVHASESRPGH